jgi:RNA polymerase sigma factor (sigma-70 family)
MVDEFAPDAAEEDRLLRLVREAQTGNAAALNQLLAAVRPFMKANIEKLLGEQKFRQWDASDVVQESLVKVSDHLAQLQAATAPQFRAWLAQIARREFLDAARHAQQQKRNVQQQIPLPQDSGGQVKTCAGRQCSASFPRTISWSSAFVSMSNANGPRLPRAWDAVKPRSSSCTSAR